MKIAAVSEDRANISQHFGRAPEYVVLTVENGKIAGRETREKTGHNSFAGQHGHHDHSGPHGCDAGAQSRHASMMGPLSDCEVLLAGGMGWGAYEALKSRGIKPIVTDVKNIDEAAGLYIQGKLTSIMERLH